MHLRMKRNLHLRGRDDELAGMSHKDVQSHSVCRRLRVLDDEIDVAYLPLGRDGTCLGNAAYGRAELVHKFKAILAAATSHLQSPGVPRWKHQRALEGSHDVQGIRHPELLFEGEPRPLRRLQPVGHVVRIGHHRHLCKSDLALAEVLGSHQKHRRVGGLPIDVEGGDLAAALGRGHAHRRAQIGRDEQSFRRLVEQLEPDDVRAPEHELPHRNLLGWGLSRRTLLRDMAVCILPLEVGMGLALRHR
mmetsp:Transcript_56583/g.183983  ORF Transcript_56583/g.183983 Transcript_56583/m.183983 type:complete len:247 (-) Transcript_56583:1305-2045(-)